MNDVIKLLKAHRSIRKFTDQPIDPDLLADMIRAGQAAATSSFLQGVTVIRVTDAQKRAELARLAGGQAYVESAAEFLVFCGDLRRASKCCDWHGATATEGFTEQFIIATVDAALMAQNVVIAAESAGLGICYIGGIRNNPQEVSELLELPRLVTPVFGLCLGWPDQDPDLRPRLPLAVMLKENRYDDSADRALIEAYDEEVRAYYQNRAQNQPGADKVMSWSEQMSGMLSREARPHMRGFLEKRGFATK
jgi:nitroreductase